MAKRKATSAATSFGRRAKTILAEAARTVRGLERSAVAQVAQAAELLAASLESGGTVFFCGNGGSAADAQHLATELSGRFLLDRPALPAVALTTNTSALTAIGNDYGFKHVFSRQLEGLGMPGDVLVAISTSGKSANVLEGVRMARVLGMAVIGMTGHKGTRFAGQCDVALVTPSQSTPRIQEGHVVMGHAVCELVERALFAPGSGRSTSGRARRAATPGRSRRS